LITDAQGVPLALQLTGANLHDSQKAIDLLDAIPAIKGRRGRPRFRPERLQGDRAYDAQWIRNESRKRNVEPVLAKRNTEHGSGLGVHRWVVERTFAWLNHFRRLRLRFEKRSDIHEALLCLGCILICWSFLS
jgi:transposase